MKNKQPNLHIRDQIVARSKWLIRLMYLLAVIIVGQIIYLQFVKRDSLLKVVKGFKNKESVIFAERGNIYATDGQSLLATTVPKYWLLFNPSQLEDTIKIRRKNLPDSLVLLKPRLDSLCLLLARTFPEKDKEEFKNELLTYRKNKKQYLRLLPRLITVEERNIVKTFPFFREHSLEDGGYFEDVKIRVYPFGQMAKRTIGKVRTDTTKGLFGIEFSFDRYLAGRNGVGRYDEIMDDKFQAVETTEMVQPISGKDIITTIDINLQDIVESALLNRLIETNAKYGTVVLMEIKTGEIRAIANYGRQTDPSGKVLYADDKNYAVTEGTDPGSTFKLASMIALLEKTKISPDAFAADCKGSVQHSTNLTLTCSHDNGHGPQTVRQAFENSCNVGFYHLIKKYFGFSKSSDFIAYLEPLKLTEKVPYQLKSNIRPILKKTTDKDFHSTTIPWMSIGYELRLTPLQMLTFYNAIANDGHWVEPILVKQVREANHVLQEFKAYQSSSSICSDRTLKLVKQMMEGVVLQGTAENIKNGYCQVAGKTGTAQKKSAIKAYREGSQVYTSFIGYFPANSPKYSCIVAIDEPQNGSLYGNTIAAPVFRIIADKVFAYDANIHLAKKVKQSSRVVAHQQKGGLSNDFIAVQKKLNLPYPLEASNEWVYAKSNNDNSIKWQIVDNKVNLPDVKGMVLRDAIAILENKGLRVKFSGKGKVETIQRQEGNTVLLTLQ